VTFARKISPTQTMSMTKAIEIKLPGKNPTTVFVHALRSIVFQKNEEGTSDEDLVIIGIDGWAKPYAYRGSDALVVYTKLVSMFEVVQLDV